MTAETRAPAVELVPLVAPDDVDAPEAADFRTMVDIRNRVHDFVYGTQATVITPAQAVPAWREQTDEEIHGFLIRERGEAVGRAIVYIPLEDGSKVAEPRVDILPEHWGRGVGRVVLARLEAFARARGRTIMHGMTNHLQLGGERTPARTGWGDVPIDHMSRTMRSAGYELEQVYRASALDVSRPLDRIHERLAEARREASGYRYVSWTLPTPPARQAGYARMKSRMSTDAPVGDMVWDEETWDAARVARVDARMVAQGFTGLIGAIEHLATGELVAYNELYHLGDPRHPTTQNDTLVLREHRGHRLGMLVKCENLLRWREIMPESTKVMTNNAEENRPMLDINEAMGFVPIAYGGAWQKTVS